MPAMELLAEVINVDIHKLSKNEIKIVEAELFFQLCEELKVYFKIEYKNYFKILKFKTEEASNMLEENFLRCIVNDILSTAEYSLPGIACYTQEPEEVIYDLAAGINPRPSMMLFRKIIELHRSVRVDLYKEIMRKIISGQHET